MYVSLPYKIIEMNTKSERIEFRITESDKELFSRAQELSGFSSLAAFITQTMKETSDQIIADNQRVLASSRDQKLFFKTLFEQDLEPNEALVSAAKRYRKLNR